VRVFGHTYSESSGRREVRTLGPNEVVGAAKVSPTSVVEVWVEFLDSSLGEDFGWKRETGAIIRNDLAEPNVDPTFTANFSIAQRRARAKELVIHREFEALMEESLIDQIFISPTLWKGSVTLPVASASGIEKRYRLAIAEYEEYLVDDDADDRGGDAYDSIPESKDRRLVFMEYVALN